MSWLTNFVRPKIRALVKHKEVPENLWTKCPGCDQMIFRRDLKENLYVCQNCGHHMRIPLAERLKMLFDDGKYTSVDLPNVLVDPLNFRDDKKYTDRLKEARNKTGAQDAVTVAYGKLNNVDVVVAGLNFLFMGGSMGVAVGEAFVRAAEIAVERHAPLIAITASGGARMQEGALSLMQMPRTVIAVQMVKEAGLPYIVLLTDPTTGGVSASFAMLGDVHITEPGAMIGFAGARVIEQTVREILPNDFQTAEYLLEHGMVDIVVKRPELRETLGRVVRLLHNPRPVAKEVAELLPAPSA
jgi:acetyl-CoA carboxylase carboxyl transferase subunit beta